MAHRIAKKQHQLPQKQNEPLTEMPHYNQGQQPNIQNHPRLPRPILPSVDKIYTHDKFAYKQKKLAFPPPQSLFMSNNNYDAGPEFIRPSSAFVFGNPKKSNFPLGAWISPFGSDKVHKVRVEAPLRCPRCKAYNNGYFRYDGNKTSATCNICAINFGIDTGKTDANNLNSTEIATQGVVDFVVRDKMYFKKKTNIIKIIFLIEVNNFIIESGAFNTIIDSIKAAIDNTLFQKLIRFGVVLYNGQSVTYLKLAKGEDWNLRMPKKYSVRYCAQSLCCPLSDAEMLFDPSTQKDKLMYLLDCVTSIAQDQYKNGKFAPQSANYAVAVKSILQNFNDEVGRIMLFSHFPPKVGPMAIRPHNQQDNKTPLKPLSQDYVELSKQMNKARVGLDMYIISKQPLANLQLATTHFLASHTGGSIHLYSPFQAQNHNQNLYYNIYGSLTRKYVYQVNFTARLSNGLNVVSYGIGDGIHEVRDIFMGMYDPGNSIAVYFQQEQKIQDNNAAYVQFAMMFTNGDGQRIIRVINYRFQVTNKIEVMHEASDYLAVSNLLLRQTVNKMYKNPALKVRQQLMNRLIVIVFEYVQEEGNKIKNSLFMAHPSLCPAFAYVHAFINSKVVMNQVKVPADYRILEILKINSGGFLAYATYFYPKLFSLGMEIYDESPVPGDLIQGQGEIEQSVVLPPSLPLTVETIKKDGVYLQWAPDYLLVVVQPEAPAQLLEQIFGTGNWDQLQEMTALPQLETAHNIRINLMLEQLRRRTTKYNGIFLPLLVRTPKRKGPFHDLMSMILKEDYPEFKFYAFMDTIHRQVQVRLK